MNFLPERARKGQGKNSKALSGQFEGVASEVGEIPCRDTECLCMDFIEMVWLLI
jgi:hypothetical protein